MLVNGGALLDRAGERPDLEQIRQVERLIGYANSRGITVWIHAWWSGKTFRDQVGEVKARRWWRYLVRRFGAYHVMWTLAGEYNMNNYGGMGLQFWKDLGVMIRREDPYPHLLSTHPTPPSWQGGAEAPQWSTGDVLHSEPWLDYNQSQVGHAKSRNEMIPQIVAADYARTPAKPTVVTEPWYEFVDGSPSPEEIRFGAWSAILSGAAGHTYGGGHIWWAHVPEAPMAPSTWPLHREFDTDTLDYSGARSMSFMAKFFKGIEWWKLEPHPELISDYPARYCAAAPGREYVILARWAGVVKVDLSAAQEASKLRYEWLDLVESKVAATGEVSGGAIREFRSPEDFPKFARYKDWVLHISGC